MTAVTNFDFRIPAIDRRKPITIWVNGSAVRAYEGEILHAVLLASGYRKIRKSVSGTEHRGFFCGMGTCYECAVTVDGKPLQRACVTEVYDGMGVDTDD
jgi:predicted molibdopterin-dependent oxidoreductase YjgC